MSDARIPGAFLRPGTSSFSDFLAENAPDLLPARRSLPAGSWSSPATTALLKSSM